MRARLYVRGMKEPKDLTHAEGKEAERIISDVLVSADTPFIIEGVWSGKKSDMKFVDWERENSYASNKEETILSAQEYNEIDGELYECMLQAVVKGLPKSAKKDFWFESKRCIRLSMEINGETGYKYYQVFVKDPALYVHMQNRLSAYEKRSFAIEQENKRLEEMAGQHDF